MNWLVLTFFTLFDAPGRDVKTFNCNILKMIAATSVVKLWNSDPVSMFPNESDCNHTPGGTLPRRRWRWCAAPGCNPLPALPSAPSWGASWKLQVRLPWGRCVWIRTWRPRTPSTSPRLSPETCPPAPSRTIRRERGLSLGAKPPDTTHPGPELLQSAAGNRAWSPISSHFFFNNSPGSKYSWLIFGNYSENSSTQQALLTLVNEKIKLKHKTEGTNSNSGGTFSSF